MRQEYEHLKEVVNSKDKEVCLGYHLNIDY